MQPTKNKFLLFFVLIFISVFISNPIFYVSAYSTEVTGLELSAFNNNHNRFIRLGDYGVFATDYDLLVYDIDDSSLEKTLDVSALTTWTQAYKNRHNIAIKKINETYFILAKWLGTAGKYYYVDIDTMTTTLIGSHGTPASVDGDYVLTECDENIYSLYTANTTAVGCYRLYPTYQFMGFINLGEILMSPTISFEGQDDNIVYVLSGDSSSLNRFNVWEIDVVLCTATLFGLSDLDNSWSRWEGYLYYVANSYNTDGTSTWNDVMVVHNGSTTKSLHAEIIRFNDTFVDFFGFTETVESSVNPLRCMSVVYSGIWSDINELLEGDYRAVFVGTDYYMKQMLFEVGNLTEIEPYIEFVTETTENPYSYLGEIHYYQAVAQVGGLQNPSSKIAFMLDYTSSKAIADSWFAINPESAYVYWLSPSPIFILDNDFEIYKNQIYTYTGENFYSQQAYGNGNFTLYSTGIMQTWEILDVTTPTNEILTGSIVNGLLSFMVSARISSLEPAFEKWLLVYEVDAVEYEIEHKIVFVSSGHEDWWTDYLFPSATTPPDYTPPTGKEWVSDFVIMFIFVFVPPLVVAYLAGKSDISPMVGYIAGLAITIMIGYQSGLTPVWFVFGIIIVMIVIIIEMLHSRGRI